MMSKTQTTGLGRKSVSTTGFRYSRRRQGVQTNSPVISPHQAPGPETNVPNYLDHDYIRGFNGGSTSVLAIIRSQS
jgi:hypothetical protein